MSLERIGRRALPALGVAILAAALGAPAATPARGRAHTAAAPVPGPTIDVMVVGAGNAILTRPTTLNVPATTVRTVHGECGVAAGTPLAALVILNRVGGPSFALRDYGHCTRSPAESGQLFVSSLDGETNHGQNGWEYKVNGRSGSTGAADPSGPFGDGHRIASGSRLLWFWCQSFGGGCQRTLEVTAPSVVAHGKPFAVQVLGYDNDGNAKPMSGVRVSIGASSAVTGGSGRAMLRAPSRPGPASVRASRSGSVPSFPAALSVR
jgi:hypothetical protein